MTTPSRHSGKASIPTHERTFFATTNAAMGMRLFQSDRNAGLLIDVLRSCVAERLFVLHDFVIMPDHIHLLLTVSGEMTIERAMQFVKGRYSHRLKKEFGYLGEVWQKGFSESRADEAESFAAHRKYITENPVKAGLVVSAEEYSYCFASLARKKALGVSQKRV